MAKNFLIGNWKMNQLLSDIDSFFAELPDQAPVARGVACQSVHIPIVQQKARGKDFWVGAQDCSAHSAGAYTGEVAAQALADVAVNFTLVGHSERRQYHGEGGEVLHHKLKEALAHQLKVIFCVGENLPQREAGKTEQVLEQQLEEALAGQGRYADQLLVAYEPVWAIGTGESATPRQVQEAHAFIKEWLQQNLEVDYEAVPVLYGGSVKPSNFSELIAIDEVNGALVGGASLKVDEFNALCEIGSPR